MASQDDATPELFTAFSRGGLPSFVELVAPCEPLSGVRSGAAASIFTATRPPPFFGWTLASVLITSIEARHTKLALQLPTVDVIRTEILSILAFSNSSTRLPP
jgi:hypothetical protein